MIFLRYMKKLKKIKGKRRSKEAGQIAQIIRRKMIQRDHGDANVYSRKNIDKSKWIDE
jgi:hypothetical protein